MYIVQYETGTYTANLGNRGVEFYYIISLNQTRSRCKNSRICDLNSLKSKYDNVFKIKNKKFYYKPKLKLVSYTIKCFKDSNIIIVV